MQYQVINIISSISSSSMSITKTICSQVQLDQFPLILRGPHQNTCKVVRKVLFNFKNCCQVMWLRKQSTKKHWQVCAISGQVMEQLHCRKFFRFYKFPIVRYKSSWGSYSQYSGKIPGPWSLIVRSHNQTAGKRGRQNTCVWQT